MALTDGPQHVVFLPSWYPAADAPGSGVFFREQAQALAAAGDRVGVVAPLLAGWRRRRALRAAGVPSHGTMAGLAGVVECSAPAFAPLPGWERGRERAVAAVGRRLFAGYRDRYGLPDVLHVQSALHTGALGVELADRYGLPLVVTEHSSLLLRRVVPARQRALLAAVYRRAAVAVAVSAALRDTLAADFPRADGWECLPNLVDARFFSAPLARETTSGEFVFLALGSLDWVKGFDVLLDAMARLPPAIRLRIGGDGPWRARLQAQADALQLGGRVVFTGPLSRAQVVAEMSAAQAFVLSSRAETFGIVLAEALACGLPVVATRCGGPLDIVTGDDGLLVPPEDAGALAAAMQAVAAGGRVFDRPALRARCRARYAPDTLVARLRALHARARDARR